MAEEKYVQVRNLSGQPVTMILPEEHIRRVFGPTEVKEIPYSEVKKVYSQNGGAVLFNDYLAIEDKEIAKEFGISDDLIEHEYSWTRQDVVDLLRAPDKMDELKDALDFAPEGIRNLIADVAIELRIPDVNKRQAITDATGKDIDAMIKNQIKLEKAIGEEEAPKRTERRAEKKTTSENTGRRAG